MTVSTYALSRTLTSSDPGRYNAFFTLPLTWAVGNHEIVFEGGTTGVDDAWFGVNREFAEILKARGVPHEFHEEPGDHDWLYWDRQVRVVLALAAKRLG